jgi:hypothetical protein
VCHDAHTVAHAKPRGLPRLAEAAAHKMPSRRICVK